eukprot:CAMPEP_0198703144 /NCGR_PEP_ID=MMETSP1468-20131203/389174_1 /TAXON_ID=1461545 /ORGANISM="Mantoniella sp, Strain CCMP1436" /LENGTH=50 /DNA_ID=CAMNT_0044461797 /DNA_START=1431 /DNA_END=1583 /DNA_ORIENTATION=+
MPPSRRTSIMSYTVFLFLLSPAPSSFDVPATAASVTLLLRKIAASTVPSA